MARRRVFIPLTHPLFYESLRLLLRHPDIDLVRATADHAGGHDLIRRLDPDVVIAETTDEEAPSAEETVSILRGGARLSLSDNEFTLYQRHQRALAGAEDPFRLILEPPPTGS